MATSYIDREECIGDSLVKINSNFSGLDSNVTNLVSSLYSLSGTLVTLINNVSANLTTAATTAWVNFNGTNAVNTDCTIRSSHNVSRVRRQTGANYLIYFTTPFANVNYVVLSSGNDDVPDTTYRGTNNISQNNTVNYCNILHKGVNSSNQAIEPSAWINVAVFGGR